MTEIQNLSSPNDESYDQDIDNTDGDDVGLSLDIGGDDDNNDDINDETNITRDEAGLNSPKGEAKLHLEDETNESPNPSPATAMRNKYNINSPKGDKKKLDWGNNKSDNNSATKSTSSGGGIESLVTQVARPDPNNNDLPKQDDTNKDLQEFTQKGGFCSCFCNLWNSCSKPTVDTEHHDTPLTHIPKQPNNEKDGGLLDDNNTTDMNKNNTTLKENSISESSTIYDGNLLPPLTDDKKGKKCLVLDLDETLVHSSFKPIPKPDFIIPVEIDHVVHHVYVLKRPYVDMFLEICAKHYEIVIFTASLSKYADPLLDKLDPNKYISHRLFRESCVIHGTAYVKDLRKLGRKLKNSIIVDNSPPSYLFQPDCAVPITSWFDDQTDTQLKDFIPVLETTLKDIPDVRRILDAHNKSFRWLCNQAGKPLENYGY